MEPHPTSATLHTWTKGWEADNQDAASSAGHSRPAPWRLEAEESAINEEEATKSARARPLVKRTKPDGTPRSFKALD